ncbi:MAG TPA: hypothetical protein VEV85_20110, partial [Bryobacteraceae bacterium]|nr:hypothetical protein [Bryobacteraceae bacterium]
RQSRRPVWWRRSCLTRSRRSGRRLRWRQQTFEQFLLGIEPLPKLLDLFLLRSHLRLQTLDLILCPRRCFRRVRSSRG